MGDSIKLWADMPGVRESDVKVTLKDGLLTIAGMVSTKVYEKLLHYRLSITMAIISGSSN